MTIYVLHIDPPFLHARHYIGWTIDATADRRVGEHLSGSSKASPLIRAALLAGCTITLAHVFTGEGADRTFERSLKNRRDTRRWCPCCAVNSRSIPKFKARP